MTVAALLSPSEASALLGVKLSRFYELARLDLIPVVRLGRNVRVDPIALENFIADGGRALPGGWRLKPTDG